MKSLSELILGCVRDLNYGDISEGALIELEDHIAREVNSIYNGDDADLPRWLN